MFERFDPGARHIVLRAREEAARLRHGYLGKEHLLLVLADERHTVAGSVLRDLGVTPEGVEREIVRIVGWGPPPRFGDDDADALRALGIDLQEVRRVIEGAFGPGSLDRAPEGCAAPGSFSFTRKSKEALQLAVREARHLGHASIRPEHLLLGLVRSEGGVGGEVLAALGVAPRVVRARVLERLAIAS
ncbi:MAG TPA: Clp protease N-terminal domain-containing protein [Actinomycetota bacterium]|nr:Clp protease N-terminal domain-containing protein [Actinomycetota bacterium]